MNIIEHGVMLKIIFYLPKRLKIYENIPNTFKCQKFAKISMGRGTIKRQISKKLLSIHLKLTYALFFKVEETYFSPGFCTFLWTSANPTRDQTDAI